jgi:NapC/NirT cytochrome c family, N-terminal region
MTAIRRLFSLLPWLWCNWIAMFGTSLATVAGNGILITAVVDIAGAGANPYLATVGYLLLPMLFVFGLMFVAVGAWRHSKHGRSDGAMTKAVALVMEDDHARRRVFFVVGATLVNVTLVSLAAYQGVTYMDSTEFCGELCHSVMKPEFAAYQRSPHARVSCTKCHIGAGASWFVRSKLSGVRQVLATATGNFSRPIPTPVHHLRPARETCERCHWPQKFHGSRLLVRQVYKPDEKNTRTSNVVRLKVGGENRRTGRYEGIHWHVAPDVRIEYEALDLKRRTIGKVTMTHKGKTTVFRPDPDKVKGKKVVERRVMDCVDCHNRPTHIYDPTPEVAVDRALSLSKLDASLPFLRREAVAALKRLKGGDKAAVTARLRKGLRAFYAKHYPKTASAKAAAIDKAARELAWIHRKNIYPELKIGWGTYPSHLGHRTTVEGCFRCHDDEHTAKGDKTIAQDCDQCHDVLAEEDEKPDVPPSVLRLGRM